MGYFLIGIGVLIGCNVIKGSIKLLDFLISAACVGGVVWIIFSVINFVGGNDGGMMEVIDTFGGMVMNNVGKFIGGVTNSVKNLVETIDFDSIFEYLFGTL